MIHIAVGGINLFGEAVRPVTPEEIKKIQIPSESIIHALRHFSQVSVDWQNAVINSGRSSKEELASMFGVPGSKWSSCGFLYTPEDVLESCRRLLEHQIRESAQPMFWLKKFRGESCATQHVIDTKELKALFGLRESERIGVEGLVTITEELKGKVQIEERRQSSSVVTRVNVIELENAPQTDVIGISLRNTPSGGIRIRTAHPGQLVPPIPYQSQPEEERVYSAIFWEKHALIRHV